MFLFRQGIYCSSLADYIHQGHVVSLPPPLLLPTSLVELPCKTAQTRLVWGICLGDEILSSYMGIKFINYEIRIPSFSPTRISMESIRPVFFHGSIASYIFGAKESHHACAELLRVGGPGDTMGGFSAEKYREKNATPGGEKRQVDISLWRGKKGESFSGIGMLCHLVLRRADFLPRKQRESLQKIRSNKSRVESLKAKLMSGCSIPASSAREPVPARNIPRKQQKRRVAVRLTVADGNSQCMWCDALSGAGLEGNQS